jgi:hypothetical protein
MDSKKVSCLNQKQSSSISNVLPQNKRKSVLGKSIESFVESDVDEQLLAVFPFSQRVRLQAMELRGPKDGSAPKVVKVFANEPNLTFDDVETRTPTLTLTLTREAVEGGARHMMNVAKFSNVDSVTVFVESNQQSTDTTRLVSIEFFGQPLHGVQVNDLEKMSRPSG